MTHLQMRDIKATSTTSSRRRPGVALLAALSLLAMLGLLLAGAVAVAAAGQHAARLSATDGVLIGAADYAVGELLGDPRRFGLADLPLGRATPFAVSVSGFATVRASATATRLPSGVYWLVGRALMADADSARRRVNVVARTVWVGRPPAAPFVSRGSTVLSPDVSVQLETAGEADCAITSVPSAIDNADSLAVFDAPGTWTRLASATGVHVVHGDTAITSGSLDGILMVEGSLSVDGAFDMRGLILARGPVRSSIGLHLTGAIVSQAAGAGAIDLRGASVRYAPCLVGQILRRASSIEIVRGWGWTELF